MLTQAPQFNVSDGILYILDPRQKDRVQVVVHSHLRDTVLMEYHAGRMSGHFSGLHETLTFYCSYKINVKQCIKNV